MNEIEIKSKNETEKIKLYSIRAINITTFLGGPLGASYMIGENFKALNKPVEARNSLIIGILSTIIIITGTFMIPENIINKIPRQIIPLVYTGIIWGIVEWKQGNILRSHKENGNLFFSGWRAAGIGFLSLILILIVAFGYVFLGADSEVYDKYDAEFRVFSENEKETLAFYNHLETESGDSLIQELENIAIPKWKENIDIINKTNNYENLPQELIQQNKLLLKYAELRLEVFSLFKKSIQENTDEYSLQIEKIHKEIEEVLTKLN